MVDSNLSERSERPADTEFNIKFTEKALNFIRSRELKNPSVMIDVNYIRTRCCITPRLIVEAIEAVDAKEEFLKIETSAGIPIYARRGLIDTAGSDRRSFDIDVGGSWRSKRLRLKGIRSDLLAPALTCV